MNYIRHLKRKVARIVRAVPRGEGYVSPGVSEAVLSDYRKQVTDPLDLLSSREREVLQLIAEGKGQQGDRYASQPERLYG